MQQEEEKEDCRCQHFQGCVASRLEALVGTQEKGRSGLDLLPQIHKVLSCSSPIFFSSCLITRKIQENGKKKKDYVKWNIQEFDIKKLIHAAKVA